MQAVMIAMRRNFRGLGNPARALVAAVALLALGWSSNYAPYARELATSIDNNQPIRNPGGHAATFSTQGFVDLTGEYFQAQGTNGRSCVSCHVPEEAWSINPGTLQRLFDESDGTAPIFHPLDADTPTTADFSTVAGRRAAYSMLLSRGVVRR